MTWNRARQQAARIAAVAGVVVLGASLAACSQDSADQPTPTASASAAAPTAEATPPVMADVATLDGSTVTVPLGGTLVLTGDTDPVTDWSATTDPEGTVQFNPGKDDGSATFNPGFTPLKEGSAKVTLTNSSTGSSATFTIEVTAAK